MRCTAGSGSVRQRGVFRIPEIVLNLVESIGVIAGKNKIPFSGKTFDLAVGNSKVFDLVGLPRSKGVDS